MVEFALVAPAFIILLLGVVEVGMFMNAQATIDNNTREVARVVALCGSSGGGWSYRGHQPGQTCPDAAASQVQLGILSPNNLQVAVCTTIPASGHCAAGYEWPTYVGQQVEVDFYYTYRYYVDPLLGQLSPTTVISSSARVVAQQ
jgi:hypothetical protein